MTSLDSITLDHPDLTPRGYLDGARLWQHACGDAVLLYVFNKPPDISAPLQEMNKLRDSYRRSVVAAGLGLVEVDVVEVDGCPAVRTIFKAPQEPHGMTYVGCFTLPFRDFSYVVKAQCEEEGTTGVRDSFVLAKMIAEDRFDLSEAEDGKIPGWWQDPYDPTVESPIMRNLSEDEQYDAQFPDHPLSRLRNILRQLQPVIRVSHEVKNAAPFVYEELEQPVESSRPGKRWWKLR